MRAVNERPERGKNDKEREQRKEGEGRPKGRRGNSKERGAAERGTRARRKWGKDGDWEEVAMKVASASALLKWKKSLHRSQTHLSACAGEMRFLDFPRETAQAIGKQLLATPL